MDVPGNTGALFLHGMHLPKASELSPHFPLGGVTNHSANQTQAGQPANRIKPPRLPEMRQDHQRDARSALAPLALTGRRDGVKVITPRRHVAVVGDPSRARFTPIGIQSLEPVTKNDILRCGEIQPGVAEFELVPARRDPHRARRLAAPAGIPGGVAAFLWLAIHHDLLQPDDRTSARIALLFGINHYDAASCRKAQQSGACLQTGAKTSGTLFGLQAVGTPENTGMHIKSRAGGQAVQITTRDATNTVVGPQPQVARTIRQNL